MNTQINIRLSKNILLASKKYAKKQGFSTIQEFIKETIREKLFGKEITEEEYFLIKKLVQATKEKSELVSKEKLFKELDRK